MSNVHIGYHRYHEGFKHAPEGHYITTQPNSDHSHHHDHGNHTRTGHVHTNTNGFHHHNPAHAFHGNHACNHGNQHVAHTHHVHAHPHRHGTGSHVHNVRVQHHYHAPAPITRPLHDAVSSHSSGSCGMKTCCCHNEMNCGYNYERAYYCDHAEGHDCGLVLAVEKVPPIRPPKIPEMRTWREYPPDSPRRPPPAHKRHRFRYDKHLGRMARAEVTDDEDKEEDSPKNTTDKKPSSIRRTRPSSASRAERTVVFQQRPASTKGSRISSKDDTQVSSSRRGYADDAKDDTTLGSSTPDDTRARLELTARPAELENVLRSLLRAKSSDGASITSSNSKRSSKVKKNKKSSHRIPPRPKYEYPSTSKSPYSNSYKKESSYEKSVGIYSDEETGSGMSYSTKLDSIIRSTAASRARQQPSAYIGRNNTDDDDIESTGKSDSKTAKNRINIRTRKAKKYTGKSGCSTCPENEKDEPKLCSKISPRASPTDSSNSDTYEKRKRSTSTMLSTYAENKPHVDKTSVAELLSAKSNDADYSSESFESDQSDDVRNGDVTDDESDVTDDEDAMLKQYQSQLSGSSERSSLRSGSRTVVGSGGMVISRDGGGGVHSRKVKRPGTSIGWH